MADLTDARNHAWRSLIDAMLVLEDALDRQSQRDGGLPHAHYRVLVVLYEAPDHRCAMSALAGQLRHSLSRLAHAVTSMEKSGLVTRSRSTDDRRVQFVHLTDVGIRLVKKVSPIQAREIRATALADLGQDQLLQLESITTGIVAALDREPRTP